MDFICSNQIFMLEENDRVKGRGAQINTPNPFHNVIYDENPLVNLEDDQKLKTQYIPVHPKTALNKVKSPDIPMDFSINPYQGCEHGCIYCYARNTHPYWGYSAGTEFEQKILVKNDIALLLEEKIKNPNWKARTIMLSGNTDCYQPIEKKLELTRAILQVLWKYKHPVGIITKNSLILRDIDILSKMARNNLVRVSISITTLDEKLRQVLEPRTSSVNNRLNTVKKLAENGIPVNVMMAPIIPGLNEHEIFKIGEWVSSLGAKSIHYTMVRLNGDVATIFENWLEKTFPDRAEKILNKIKSTHGGSLNDSRFGKRMVGEGKIAEIIKKQFTLMKKKYFPAGEPVPLNFELHRQIKNPQLELF